MIEDIKITNFFLTGEKGIGKSTLLKEIQEAIVREEVCGFVTLPYYEGLLRKGFYMHSLLPIEGNNQPISIQYTVDTCEPILHTFETLGVAVLRASQRQQNKWMIVDEIGVLESKAVCFQKELETCLASTQIVLGVLKERNHPFISRIKERKDTRLYKVTASNRLVIKEAFIRDIQEHVKEVS